LSKEHEKEEENKNDFKSFADFMSLEMAPQDPHDYLF